MKVRDVRGEARSRGRPSPESWAFWACETTRQYSRLLTALEFSLLVQAPGTCFYTWVEWGAAYRRTMVSPWPNEHSQRTGPPSSANHFSLPKGKTVSPSEFRTRDLSIPSPTLCRCATLALQSTGWYWSAPDRWGFRRELSLSIIRRPHPYRTADGSILEPSKNIDFHKSPVPILNSEAIYNDRIFNIHLKMPRADFCKLGFYW